MYQQLSFYLAVSDSSTGRAVWESPRVFPPLPDGPDPATQPGTAVQEQPGQRISE